MTTSDKNASFETQSIMSDDDGLIFEFTKKNKEYEEV